MSEQKIKAGDTVSLKSGGPNMTAELVETKGGGITVSCVWFFNAELKRASFYESTLKLSNVDSSSMV